MHLINLELKVLIQGANIYDFRVITKYKMNRSFYNLILGSAANQYKLITHI